MMVGLNMENIRCLAFMNTSNQVLTMIKWGGGGIWVLEDYWDYKPDKCWIVQCFKAKRFGLLSKDTLVAIMYTISIIMHESMLTLTLPIAGDFIRFYAQGPVGICKALWAFAGICLAGDPMGRGICMLSAILMISSHTQPKQFSMTCLYLRIQAKILVSREDFKHA